MTHRSLPNMPILPKEPDIYPEALLDDPLAVEDTWWLLYTRSRQEKALLRYLRQHEIPHYAPMIPQRYRSPAGRIRESFVPLFSTYVFLRGGNEERYQAVCSGNVMKADEIVQVDDLVQDLTQIRDLIAMDVPMSLESRIEAGDRVRIKNGHFAGYEGLVERRENETVLLISVRFMEQGVSVRLDDCQVEVIG